MVEQQRVRARGGGKERSARPTTATARKRRWRSGVRVEHVDAAAGERARRARGADRLLAAEVLERPRTTSRKRVEADARRRRRRSGAGPSSASRIGSGRGCSARGACLSEARWSDQRRGRRRWSRAPRRDPRRRPQVVGLVALRRWSHSCSLVLALASLEAVEALAPLVEALDDAGLAGDAVPARRGCPP